MSMIRLTAQVARKTTKNAGLAPFAEEASSLLKVLGHEGRLLVLCHLREGARTVGELQTLMNASQPVVSGHLARLRFEGLVDCERVGKSAVYYLADRRMRHMLDALDAVFCNGLTNRQTGVAPITPSDN